MLIDHVNRLMRHCCRVVAIRELIDASAHTADRRETDKQVALFTPDGIIENIHNAPGKDKETAVLRGHKDLAAESATLKKFEMTMHFNGQSTIRINWVDRRPLNP